MGEIILLGYLGVGALMDGKKKNDSETRHRHEIQ